MKMSMDPFSLGFGLLFVILVLVAARGLNGQGRGVAAEVTQDASLVLRECRAILDGNPSVVISSVDQLSTGTKGAIDAGAYALVSYDIKVWAEEGMLKGWIVASGREGAPTVIVNVDSGRVVIEGDLLHSEAVYNISEYPK